MMTLNDIDKSMAFRVIDKTDVEWRSALQEPFSLHGVIFSEKEGCYRRMNSEIAHDEGLNEGITYLSRCTAGGRLRFKTNSPYITLRCAVPNIDIIATMSLVASMGFSMYVNGVFSGNFTPIWANLLNPVDGEPAKEGWYYKEERNTITYEGILKVKGEGERDIDIYFPLYGGVKDLYIGVQEGSTISAPRNYSTDGKVLFYGSSITQGGHVSHPGNDYASLVCRWLDVDYINLGFAGNATSQPVLMKYMASLSPRVFVFDYDHNATNPEFLEKTHLTGYRAFRSVCKTAHIIFITKPDSDNDEFSAERREIIYNTYKTALAEGDNLVSYIDGSTLFGTLDRELCTVDMTHPNDLGFYRMAKTVKPVLEKCLNKINIHG